MFRMCMLRSPRLCPARVEQDKDSAVLPLYPAFSSHSDRLSHPRSPVDCHRAVPRKRCDLQPARGSPPLQTQISPRSLLILPSVFVLVSEGNGRAHARTRKVPVPGVRGEIHDTLTPPTPGAVSRGLRLRAPYARLRLCGEGGGCFWAADGPHLRCMRLLSVEV